MKPVDFRNETYATLRRRLTDLREKVWLAWTAYEIERGTAGATTRQVCEWLAAKSRARGEPVMDILTFRPRCTELYHIGALACVEDEDEVPSPNLQDSSPKNPGEGHYRIRSIAEWEAWAEQKRESVVGRQLQMPLSA